MEPSWETQTRERIFFLPGLNPKLQKMLAKLDDDQRERLVRALWPTLTYAQRKLLRRYFR